MALQAKSIDIFATGRCFLFELIYKGLLRKSFCFILGGMNETIKYPGEYRDASVEQVNPEILSEAVLQGMKRLYCYDAAEAYSKVVDDERTKEELKNYFDSKAEKLPEALHDPSQRFWLAMQAGKVVGMAGYNIERHLIHSVYISDEVRGQGIGSNLMRHLIRGTGDISEGLPRTILVAQPNTRAIEFYERLGFEPTGSTKDWNIGDASIPEVELAIGG